MEDWSNISNGEDGLSVREKLNSLGKQSAPLIGTETLLFRLLGADLSTTDDQMFEKTFDFTNFVVTRVIAGGAPVPPTSAVGGIYSAPAKGGTAIVATNQAWSSLNTPQRVFFATLGAIVNEYSVASPFLSLTTAATVPSTCNIFIMGFVRPS